MLSRREFALSSAPPDDDAHAVMVDALGGKTHPLAVGLRTDLISKAR
jgi:hypothetical protein